MLEKGAAFGEGFAWEFEDHLKHLSEVTGFTTVPKGELLGGVFGGLADEGAYKLT